MDLQIKSLAIEIFYNFCKDQKLFLAVWLFHLVLKPSFLIVVINVIIINNNNNN